MLMMAVEATTKEEVGECCFYHERPEYRAKAKAGYSILVAGKGFGTGSSRETGAFTSPLRLATDLFPSTSGLCASRLWYKGCHCQSICFYHPSQYGEQRPAGYSDRR